MEQTALRQMALSMLNKWRQPNEGGSRVCAMIAGPLILPALLLCPCTDPSVKMPDARTLELTLENALVVFEYDVAMDFQGVARSIAESRGVSLDGVLVADIILNLKYHPIRMLIMLRNMPGYEARCEVTGSDIDNILFNFPITLRAMASALGPPVASQ